VSLHQELCPVVLSHGAAARCRFAFQQPSSRATRTLRFLPFFIRGISLGGFHKVARRPTDYGARARAGGTCLVAVLHVASVIGCWGRAAGAASLRTAPDAPPPHTPGDASRIQNIIHKTPTQLPTYNDASRTRRTPPTLDDASRMQYRHRTCATSPGPGPIVSAILQNSTNTDV